MIRTFRQCYRHHRWTRPPRDMWDVACWLRDYYARYYGRCRAYRTRTLRHKAEHTKALFFEVMS